MNENQDNRNLEWKESKMEESKNLNKLPLCPNCNSRDVLPSYGWNYDLIFFCNKCGKDFRVGKK
jgi:hypothetical protein